MKIISISEINNYVEDNAEQFILKGEKEYKKELSIAADKVYLNSQTNPIVLISGPSGSGKTTSALQLEKLLKKKGISAHTISMDNYFLTIDDIDNLPKGPDGTIDLESPYRLDIPLLKKHIQMLNEYKEIEVPIYDFKTSSRVGYKSLKREKNAVIILEGIHALNPLITGDCKDFSTLIYVSVRTRIENKEADRLHPKLIRLMRRLSRDKLFRSRILTETFKMFKSVSRGEEEYIMQFKPLADIDIDTFIPFEVSAYRTMLYDNLIENASELRGNFGYDMIVEFLKDLTPLPTQLVPTDSLIREFIGE